MGEAAAQSILLFIVILSVFGLGFGLLESFFEEQNVVFNPNRHKLGTATYYGLRNTKLKVFGN